MLIAITVDDSLGSQSLFITGDKLGQIRATKEVCAQFLSLYISSEAFKYIMDTILILLFRSCPLHEDHNVLHLLFEVFFFYLK